MTPSELYMITPQSVETDEWNIICGYHEFLTESGTYEYEIPEDAMFEKRLVCHTIHHENLDGTRFWDLCALYFDEIPFMITQRAGRGSDYSRRFITDHLTFMNACNYIRSLVPINERDVYELLEDIEDLDNFYGYSLDEFEKYP